MKRFIDLREHDQDIGYAFAWFDTIVDRFEDHNGMMVFDTWEDFEFSYTGTELDRYRRLVPVWVFKD